MRKLIGIVLLLTLAVTAKAQVNLFGGIGSRVLDSATYRASAAVTSAHSNGYQDIYFNAQATTPHWDRWTGAAYEHIFNFQGGTGGGSVVWGAITGTLADQTDVQSALNAKGDKSGNLSQFAATTSAQLRGVMSDETGTLLLYFQGGDIGTPSAGVGTNITGIVGTNVTNTPAGNIAATTSQAAINELDGEKASLTGTETLSNKRLTPRVQAVTSSATVTPNADSDDAVKVTAQAAGITWANPSGTPTSMQALILRLKDNGTARAITWGSQYRGIGLTLPATTVISKTMYFGLVWNSDDSKWDVIGYSLEQ